MKPDWFVKSLLVVAVIFLGVVAFRPISQPPTVMAQDGSPYTFDIEHGTVSLPKSEGTTTWGKIAVEMRNGDVWGFLMQAQNTPYPVYGPQ